MFEYLPGNSLLHRFDVRTKAVGFVMITVLAFLFASPFYNLVLALLCLGFALLAGVTGQMILDKLKPLALIFVLVILMTGFSYPAERFATPIAQHTYLPISQYFALTSGGLLYGVTFFLRILVMILSSTALISTTPLEDFLQLLQMLRMPYQLAFVVTTAIRFVPTMERKTGHILDAQRARGAELGRGAFFNRIRTYVPIMVPMLVEAVRMSESLAVAMLNRGYGAKGKATQLKELQLAPRDYLFSALFVVITLIAIILAYTGYGRL